MAERRQYLNQQPWGGGEPTWDIGVILEAIFKLFQVFRKQAHQCCFLLLTCKTDGIRRIVVENPGNLVDILFDPQASVHLLRKSEARWPRLVLLFAHGCERPVVVG